MPKVGVGILVLQKGKILMSQRKLSHGEGTWALPGGHLEFEEPVLNCVCRELFEETGLLAKEVILGPWREVLFPGEKLHYINLYSIVTKFSGILINKEPEKTTDWQWFGTTELPTPLFLPLAKILPLDSFLEKELENKAPHMVESTL